jgi:hypothetical protein
VTRILLLAERPMRDLRSRALLEGLPARLGARLLIRSTAPRWPEGFESVPPDADPATLGLSRVVLAGAFQSRRHFDEALDLAARAAASGIPLDVLNLTLEGGTTRGTAPPSVAVLGAVASIGVRDHVTADALLVWRVAAPLVLDPYPERHLAADPALATTLPAGPILGLGLLGGPGLEAAIAERSAALRGLLARFAGWPILPLAAEAVDSAAEDGAGTLALARALLPDSPILLPELADPAARRRVLTPGRLKGLVARCAHVVTSHDLVAGFAIATGVSVLGIGLPGERRIGACLATLANAAPEGSNLAYPGRDSSSALA